MLMEVLSASWELLHSQCMFAHGGAYDSCSGASTADKLDDCRCIVMTITHENVRPIGLYVLSIYQ